MLINLRNALMAGRRLPYDAEVEFLGMTGGQYINTGIIGSSATKVEITAYSTNVTTTMALFGARNASNGNRPSYSIWRRAVQAGGERMRFDYNSASADSVVGGDWNASTDNTITKDNVSNYINGTLASVNTAHSFSLDIPFYLGTINGSGTPATYYFVGRIYSCKIYDANGVLVRDYIPVRRGTIGYLYDRVSGKLFGNAGTGDFVLGQDVVSVEYIESHGTEYIDIPVSGTPNEYFGIKGLVKITNTSQRVKAVWDTETNRQFGSSGYAMSGASYVFSSWIGAKNASGGWLVLPGVLYPFEVSTLGRTLNGVFNPLSRNITSAFFTLRLFGKYGTTEYSGNASVAFGALTITDGTGNARNFRPVRVGTEGAMMDVLTRRIYRNAGTGAFGYGNDMKYPIPAS